MSKVIKYKKQIIPVLALILAILLGQPLLSYAQYQEGFTVRKANLNDFLTEVSMQGTASGIMEGVKLANPQTIQAFYQTRHNKPAWVKRDRLAQARAIHDVLKDSWTHGLNPATYHASEIGDLLALERLNPAAKARLELLLSDAVMRYGRDMTGMRVAPQAIGQKASYWRAAHSYDEVLNNISRDDDPAAALRAFAPQSAFYNALREELIRLSAETAAYEERPELAFGGLLRPGERHKEVANLRARMGGVHDAASGQAESVYDPALAELVKEFQGEHGLKADGVIGPSTLAFLNQSPRDRMEQVVANMERLRWMKQDQPERFILVNIPSQMLWAVENGEVKHEMRVVVGRKGRPTKSFSTEITGVRLNPTWTVPPTIKFSDMLPKLQEDPTALEGTGMRFYKIAQGAGRKSESIDPTTVDWANITRQELKQIRMMQTPGENNALGRVRVLMPNDYDMYLHDTNHQEHFALDDRAQSSGCIRLSEPRKIADFILSRSGEWNSEKIDAVINTGRMNDVMVEERMPVFIVYQTMWLDKDGKLVYGADIYNEDKKLLKALADVKAYDLVGGVEIRTARTADDGTTQLASVQ